MSAYLTLFIVFFKVGLFSFGGGTAMLPIIYQSVRSLGYMSAGEFSDMVALSQVTPGPVAVNAATYVGLINSGVIGAIVATIGVCLPCFLIMLAVSAFLSKFKDNRIVEGAFSGIRPVTIGLVGTAAVFIAEGVLTRGPLISASMADPDYYNLIPLGIFAVSILLMGKFKVKPIWTLLIMAGAGSLIYGISGIS